MITPNENIENWEPRMTTEAERAALPKDLQTAGDEPDALLRALNNAYVVIEERSEDIDAVANCVLHEILGARATARASAPALETRALAAQALPARWLAVYQIRRRQTDDWERVTKQEYEFFVNEVYQDFGPWCARVLYAKESS